MFSYSNIYKQAYYITKKFPSLWIFGFFVAGGMNFLHIKNLFLKSQYLNFSSPINLNIFPKFSYYYLLDRPLVLFFLCLSILVITILGLLLTNWSRIMLVLCVQEISLKKELNSLNELFIRSKKNLWPVIKISLLTSSLIILVSLILLGAPLLSQLEISDKILLWILACFIFVPIIFTISCLNIFTTYFLLLLEQNFKNSLNLGTDFFLSHWPKILGFSLVLGILFLTGLGISNTINFLVAQLVNIFRFYLSDMGVFVNLTMIWLVKISGFVAISFILAIINVYFNVAMVLFFLEIIKPIKDPQKIETVQQLTVFSPAGYSRGG